MKYRFTFYFRTPETCQVSAQLRRIFPEDWGQSEKELYIKLDRIVSRPQPLTDERIAHLKANPPEGIDRVEIEALS